MSYLINEIEEEANRLYNEYEKRAIIKYMNEKGYDKIKSAVEGVIKILENSLIISIANTRKSRGGQTSQKILAFILNKVYNIPCETSRIRIGGYEADIAIPRKEFVKKELGYILAVKRTLRERWFEDLPIFKYPYSAFVLIKPDPDFNPSKAKQMVMEGLKRAYIPDELYERYRHILERNYPNVFKKLSDLPNDLKSFLTSGPIKN